MFPSCRNAEQTDIFQKQSQTDSLISDHCYPPLLFPPFLCSKTTSSFASSRTQTTAPWSFPKIMSVLFQRILGMCLLLAQGIQHFPLPYQTHSPCTNTHTEHSWSPVCILYHQSPTSLLFFNPFLGPFFLKDAGLWGRGTHSEELCHSHFTNPIVKKIIPITECLFTKKHWGNLGLTRSLSLCSDQMD